MLLPCLQIHSDAQGDSMGNLNRPLLNHVFIFESGIMERLNIKRRLEVRQLERLITIKASPLSLSDFDWAHNRFKLIGFIVRFRWGIYGGTLWENTNFQPRACRGNI